MKIRHNRLDLIDDLIELAWQLLTVEKKVELFQWSVVLPVNDRDLYNDKYSGY
ncbi:MAG: hypothetical protein ACXAEU_19095 [Candidatus Hodarchaeales archaeon]